MPGGSTGCRLNVLTSIDYMQSSMVAIRPPEYFPRLQYMALVLEVDHFYIADTFEFSRQSYHNRTKLRNPDGWHWITVPLAWGESTAPLIDVSIQDNPIWKDKHWRAIMYDYRSTPYFEFYEDRFHTLFDEEWTTIGEFTSASLERVCELLEIDTELIRLSELDNPPFTFEAASETLPGGDLLCLPDTAEYNRQFAPGLEELVFEEPVYRQNFPGFESGMSVLDMLFNYGPETVSLISEAVERD